MEDYSKYLIAIAALVFVISLIGALSFLVKRYGSSYLNITKSANGEKRLKVVEVLQIDAQRKFILIERDNTQHLVLLSNNGDVLIENNIKNNT
jgi:flagellar protein FliO/FliZ